MTLEQMLTSLIAHTRRELVTFCCLLHDEGVHNDCRLLLVLVDYLGRISLEVDHLVWCAVHEGMILMVALARAQLRREIILEHALVVEGHAVVFDSKALKLVLNKIAG